MSTATFVWHNLLQKILIKGEVVSPRGMNTLEIINNTSIVDMRFPVVTDPLRKLGYSFMPGEAWWIMSGRNTVSDISPYSKAISTFSDNGVYFNGAYGPKIIDQLSYICDALISEDTTRQAVLSIWRENPRDSKDIPCTITLQWFIRNQKIHCIDNMRSSDAWLGWPYDIFNMTMLTGMILLLIREINPRMDSIGLGNIYLNAGSQHLYFSNMDKAKHCVEQGDTMKIERFDPYSFRNYQHLITHLKLVSDKHFDNLDNNFLKELENF